MEKMIRKNPGFSLCGLNCCLCPRFNADGKSRCPGCGGPGFSEQRPTCPVATCNRKHDNVEYCFQCSAYPCKKYENESKCDSFISYKSVRQNFIEAKEDLAGYMETLERRRNILRTLLANFNDGRSKGFYCLIANDMPLDELESLLETAERFPSEIPVKEKAQTIRRSALAVGERLGVKYALRKRDS